MNDMKDADLKRNASGYYDEPCYKAVTAPPRPGEIWTKAGTDEIFLCLASNEKASSCMKLNEKQMNVECIPVILKNKTMYTDPMMIGYTFNKLLNERMYSLTECQMESIRRSVGKALGIHDLSDRNAELLKERDKLIEEKGEIHLLKIELERERKFRADAAVQLEKANVYKEMYLELIDKLVSVRGGAVVND